MQRGAGRPPGGDANMTPASERPAHDARIMGAALGLLGRQGHQVPHVDLERAGTSEWCSMTVGVSGDERTPRTDSLYAGSEACSMDMSPTTDAPPPSAWALEENMRVLRSPVRDETNSRQSAGARAVLDEIQRANWRTGSDLSRVDEADRQGGADAGPAGGATGGAGPQRRFYDTNSYGPDSATTHTTMSKRTLKVREQEIRASQARRVRRRGPVRNTENPFANVRLSDFDEFRVRKSVPDDAGAPSGAAGAPPARFIMRPCSSREHRDGASAVLTLHVASPRRVDGERPGQARTPSRRTCAAACAARSMPIGRRRAGISLAGR